MEERKIGEYLKKEGVCMFAIKSNSIFTGEEVIENGIILIDDEKIIKIGKINEIGIPDNCDVIDYKEKTILPGLIDSHTHLTLSAQKSNYAAGMKDDDYLLLLKGSKNMQTDLSSGVTTMRCLGEINFIDVALKDASEKGIIDGPRLLISGKGIRTSYGHGIMGTPFDGAVEVMRAARLNINAAGADQLKIFVSGSKGEFKNYKFATEKTVERNEMHCLMTKEEIEAVVNVAHSVGKKVAAHCYGGIGLKYCVEAGVDTIEHGIYMDDTDIDLMIKHDTWLTLTLSAYFSDKRLENRGTPELTRGFFKYRDDIDQAYRKAIKAGIKYAVGTDGLHGELFFELEKLVEFGVSPINAIKAATSNAALMCNVEDKVGTLNPGKFADLIVIDGQPFENIKDVRNIIAVYKGGSKI